jgi:hypothetical protein
MFDESTEKGLGEIEKFCDCLLKFIQTELTKRGFHVKFKTFEIRKNKIFFESESFQTSPVLFKEIRIKNFASGISVKEDMENSKIKTFWVMVNVEYNHFDYGSNGCNIFTVTGRYDAENDIIQCNIE